ncbi:MAG: dihydrolipoyllysine-residue acetyltransferase [Burkholderiaceae bacterium]
MSETQVKVPDIGDFKDVEVIEVMVKEGDRIEVEQSLVTVESDKASMEIPSSAAGIVKSLAVRIGDKVSEGSLLLTIEAEAGAAAPSPAGGAAGGAAGKAPAADTGSAASASAPAAAAAAPAEAAAPSGGAPAAGGQVTVEVPDIGDFKDVEVIELLAAVGDTVAVEQSLVTVESDKASMEIPSSAAGRLVELLVKVGDKVSQGTPLAVVAVGGGAAAAPSPAGEPAARSASPSDADAASASASASGAASAPVSGTASASGAASASESASRSSHPVPADLRDNSHIVKPHASPSVRKFARELGVDLSKVRGTGDKQRILHADVQAYVKGVMTAAPAAAPAAPIAAGDGLNLLPWPKVDFAKFGQIEAKPLSRIKKISAANLHRNWVMIPHVTNNDEADITELEALRVRLNQENAKSGVKVTMLAFVIKAVVATLKKFPEFNASLDGEQLIYKRYWHIGFAADTPNGLVVPVLKDADRKGVFEIAAETSALAAKARDGKLSPSDMQGGTFSISSLGGIGGTHFTPIINAPEVAILGLSRSANKPVWDDKSGAFVPRLTLPLSLSYDHRVIDGAAAARFNAHLAQLLADFRRVLL